MNNQLKIILIIVYLAIVLFLVFYASGYISSFECDFYKFKKKSLLPIVIIAVVTFLITQALKLPRDSTFMYVFGITLVSFFIMRHFHKKRYHQILNQSEVTIAKATINKIGKQQFTTYLSFNTVRPKIGATLSLERKDQLGQLKVGDTILIKYVKDCPYIFGFHNLNINSPPAGASRKRKK